MAYEICLAYGSIITPSWLM